MKVQWLGNGSLPFRTAVEYRLSDWDESTPWVETQVKYISDNVIIIRGNSVDVPYGVDVMDRMIFRPVGGVFESEYEEHLRGIVGVITATRHEKHFLWKEYFHTSRKVAWEAATSAPVVEIGRIGGRPVSITLYVDVINGHRVLFVDAISQVVDWAMIDAWLLRNVPASAFREDSQYVNKQDIANFWHVVPRVPAKPAGMQSSFSDHSPSCNRQQNGTFCDCGFS